MGKIIEWLTMYVSTIDSHSQANEHTFMVHYTAYYPVSLCWTEMNILKS